MNYQDAKKQKEMLEAASAAANAALGSLSGGGKFNLTPDSVKQTPEWKFARKMADKAFSELRAFNGYFVRTFKSEYAADRRRA